MKIWMEWRRDSGGDGNANGVEMKIWMEWDSDRDGDGNRDEDLDRMEMG